MIFSLTVNATDDDGFSATLGFERCALKTHGPSGQLAGIGGHGGSGRRADWEMRFQEIVGRVAQFLAPPTSAAAVPGASSRPLSKHKASLAPLLAAANAPAGAVAKAASPSPRPSFSRGTTTARNDDERVRLYVGRPSPCDGEC
ncbi:hypothetical protein HPB48_008325 [Haemaphysalis longicornis]|uniref:Uncharacterized protein n=1 Tax=Haemaphysalis longicornis TaxID=44386 RepID=A0A9J6FTW7_HAELO|nr:hypothetical protein HPB48_008325 [Haemaphysalis longicornis]